MSQNLSLQDLIDVLPEHVKQDIMSSNDVFYLTSLKKSFVKEPDTVTVINARIENLNYLAV